MRLKKLLTISVLVSLLVSRAPMTAFAEENLLLTEASETEDAITEEPTTEETEDVEEISELASEETGTDEDVVAESENNIDSEDESDEEEAEEEEDEENEDEENEDEEDTPCSLTIKVMKLTPCFDEDGNFVEDYIPSLENTCVFQEAISTREAVKSILSPQYNSEEYKAVIANDLPQDCPENLEITLYMDDNNSFESIDVSYTEEKEINDKE
ncbi:hypothetical protein [Pseudobutyrivibrio xylanivorans]|uniref:DUF5067 domain-containing protein n=1 Tax=Pseudobutyrivibrio xylanivorans TaxID=185007 RepID=A0A1G5S333_PSEXY|nr:hypothetical protein [Pseudobutyrivibrio xylanivorans]SCZ80161.1 hypothetical protein SAMN02910350_02155 [Pseudobutyrivibrio xylanivorans]